MTRQDSQLHSPDRASTTAGIVVHQQSVMPGGWGRSRRLGSRHLRRGGQEEATTSQRKKTKRSTTETATTVDGGQGHGILSIQRRRRLNPDETGIHTKETGARQNVHGLDTSLSGQASNNTYDGSSFTGALHGGALAHAMLGVARLKSTLLSGYESLLLPRAKCHAPRCLRPVLLPPAARSAVSSLPPSVSVSAAVLPHQQSKI